MHRGGHVESLLNTTKGRDDGMSKDDVIIAIQRFNPTAGREFLAGFDEGSLRHYLQRLTTSRQRRGSGGSSAVRDPESSVAAIDR